MPQNDISQTYHVQNFRTQNNDITDANSVEFRNGTPTNLAQNAKRIWVDQTDVSSHFTIDGINLVEVARKDDVELLRREIRIDVTSPPRNTGLLPVTKTNPVTDQVRLQAIFDYIQANEVNYQPNAEQATGLTYTVYFPDGQYEFATTTLLKGKYLVLKADRAIIRVTNGDYAFQSTTSDGWKLEIEGFTFDRCGGIKQNNSNIESGKTRIYNCWFYYSPAEAVWITKQSSMTFITTCHFYKCNKIALFDLTDAVYIDNCWFSEAARTALNPVDITNKTKLFIRNTFFIPAPQPDTSFEMAWIRNEDYVRVENCRISSEPGSKTIVNNHAVASPGSPYNPNGVDIFNNNPVAVTVPDNGIVRLYALPNVIRISGNNITPVATKPISYAAGYTGGDAAAFANRQDVLVVDVSGNVGVTPTAWSVPVELRPFIRNVDLLNNGNLGLNEVNPQQRLHITDTGGSTIRLARNDTSVTAGELYGTVEFFGNDASSGSAGVRASVQAAGEGTVGETALVFNVTGSASTTILEAMRLTNTKKAVFNANAINVNTAQTPASATAAGTTGDIAWDANFVYVCVATNTWKRTAISTW